jgi:hypothetical protein
LLGDTVKPLAPIEHASAGQNAPFAKQALDRIGTLYSVEK